MKRTRLIVFGLLLLTGSAVLYAQEPAIWSRGLSIIRGNLAVSTGVVHLQGTTAALTLGGGTSTTPLTTAVADKNFLGFWTKSTATSGDSRSLYLRHYFAGAGGAGEAARLYGTVSAAASASGTVNGAHVSLSIASGGTAGGTSNALRATYDMAASTSPGGTPAVIMADTAIGSSATVPASFAFFHLDNTGAAPTTNGAPLLLNILNPNTSAFFIAAGTGSGSCGITSGAVANKVLAIKVGGVDYWIPLCNSNGS